MSEFHLSLTPCTTSRRLDLPAIDRISIGIVYTLKIISIFQRSASGHPFCVTLPRTNLTERRKVWEPLERGERSEKKVEAKN